MHSLFLYFISFGITDVVDIILVAVLLYLAYNLVKGTPAITNFIGLLRTDGPVEVIWNVLFKNVNIVLP